MFIVNIFRFLFLIVFFPFACIVSLFISPKKEYAKNSKFFRWVLDEYTWFAMVILRIDVCVEGKELLPDAPFVLVQNHYSNFDPIVTWFAFKKNRLAFVSKKENFKIPFFGRMIRKCCFMAIDRENARNAVKTVDFAASLVKSGEVSVGVYPEGTRNKGYRGLLPFHNSVFKIAQKAGAPVVVVGVSGTERVHENTPWKKTRVVLKVVNVLSAEFVVSNRTAVLGEEVRRSLLAFVTEQGHGEVAEGDENGTGNGGK